MSITGSLVVASDPAEPAGRLIAKAASAPLGLPLFFNGPFESGLSHLVRSHGPAARAWCCVSVSSQHTGDGDAVHLHRLPLVASSGACQ